MPKVPLADPLLGYAAVLPLVPAVEGVVDWLAERVEPLNAPLALAEPAALSEPEPLVLDELPGVAVVSASVALREGEELALLAELSAGSGGRMALVLPLLELDDIEPLDAPVPVEVVVFPVMLPEEPERVVPDAEELGSEELEEPVPAELEEPEAEGWLEVCACSPRAAAKSAEAPHVTNAMGFFMAMSIGLMPVPPARVALDRGPACGAQTGGLSKGFARESLKRARENFRSAPRGNVLACLHLRPRARRARRSLLPQDL